MKKKVLIFSLSYYPKHVGGAEVAIKEITDRISSADVEFHMVTNRYDSTLPPVEQVGNVLVHRIGFTKEKPSTAELRTFPLHLNKIFFQFRAYQKARQLHREHHYDGIWAMMAHSCAIPAGLFKSAFPDVKYILTLQEGDPPEYIERKMRVFWPLFKRGFVRADVLQPISTFLAQWGERMGYRGPVEVIPNAVDTAHFSQRYTVEELAAVRRELGKKEGDVFLITTSRLVKKNATDDVIRALPLLPPLVHFVVYGTGPDERMLKELVKKLGLVDRVQFRGFMDHKDIPRYLQACDIFIRPSRSEGMGNSFVEAMAAGIPVIATQEGGISDFLFDARRNPDRLPTGWAVSKDAPQEIADAVLRIMKDPAATARVTTTARTMVMEHYDWNTIARDMSARVFSRVVPRVESKA